MHKWRLLLLLVLSLLQPILSEHILIDGRQCSSLSSSQSERSNGKYPFDKSIPDTLRLNTLRENRRDVQRYGEKHGTKGSRFSDSSHLERRITTYNRGQNIYEPRLYRTERDGRKTFDRDFVRKQRQVVENDARKQDTSPYARTSQENQEREIRVHFAPIQTPPQARRMFNEKLKIRDSSNIRRLRNDNWNSNINNVDITLERTGRSLRIRQNFEATNENNGDMFRENGRKRDLTIYTHRDEATNGKGLTIEDWERNISKKPNREIRKLVGSNLVRAQYRSKADKENGGNGNYVRHSRYIVRDTSSVPSVSNTHQRHNNEIKNEHIISSLDTAFKSFERNYQRTARSTPRRSTIVRNKPLDTRNTEKIWYDERQSDGEHVINRVIEQYNDKGRSLYEYARINPERRLTVERKLQQGSRSNAQDDERTNTRIEKTKLRNTYLKRDIPYRLNLRLREVTMRIVSEDLSRNQKTRNMYMYNRMDTRKEERRASDNFDRSNFVERDLRQQRTRTSSSEYAARTAFSIQKNVRQQKREERNTNVRDGRTDRIQGRYEKAILDRQIFARHDVSRKNSNRIQERYASDIKNINKYLIDDFDSHQDIKNAKSLSRYISHQEDVRRVTDEQMSSSRKNVSKRVLEAQRNGFKNYGRISERATFPRSKRISDAYDTRKGNEIKQDINKRSTDVRTLRRSDVNRVTDRQIIRSREELNALLERGSRYMEERTLERGIRKSDIRRNTNSAERIIMTKDELLRDERTTVSNERIDITNNERDLRDPILKRSVSSSQERDRNARAVTNEIFGQRKYVRYQHEREQTHLRLTPNERGLRYKTRDRAMFAERELANLVSRTVPDDKFKFEHELQRADVTKEPLRMINNVRYSRLAIRERTASTEQNSHSRDETKYNKGTDRYIHSNIESFARNDARERAIARETREQNAIRLTDKQITGRYKDTTQPRQSNLYSLRSRIESSFATLRRTDERHYRAEGNSLTRDYKRALDLYRGSNWNSINVRHHSRRQSESAYTRNIFGTTQAFINVSATLFYWQYLFYIIQGIYIFGVFMQIFRQKDAKTSSMAWLAVTPHIKVD